MGVISMQMKRQYNSVGQTKPRPSSSRKLSDTKNKKRRFAVYPPKQYPSVDMHSSRRNKRCSSPSYQSSPSRRPPRHPLSLSSSLSLPSLSDALHNIPNEIVCTKPLDLIIDEYKNEKFPAEILARLQRRRVHDIYNRDASTSTNDSDNQRDEDNEEYTTSSSNDTLGFSDTSEEGEAEEPIGQKKESIFEFVIKIFVRSIVKNTISKRIVGSLVKSKENENEDTTDNKDDANEEEVGADEQNKVLSNEAFRLLLSSQDGNSSLRTKESSERQEERVSVFEIDFEYLDIDDRDDFASLPPVTVIEEEEDSSSKFLISHLQMNAMREALLPPGLHHRPWKRIYSLSRDGDSFVAFRKLLEDWYKQSKGNHSSILVVKTTAGDMIGGYVSVPIVPFSSNLESAAGSCLFKILNANDDDNADPVVAVYGKDCGTTSTKKIIFDSTKERIAFGGGDEGFGLCLDNNFSRGTTSRCAAFRSEPLISSQDGVFDVLDMEIWGFVFGQF